MMFKNKNYVKSRFTVLATGVFLSMLITAPQSQAAFKIGLTCSLGTGVAKVSKPTSTAIEVGFMYFWWKSTRENSLLSEMVYVDPAYPNIFYTSIKGNYVQVYDYGLEKWSGLVACR